MIIFILFIVSAYKFFPSFQHDLNIFNTVDALSLLVYIGCLEV